MKEFRFSIGDSNTNGIGVAFSIFAKTEDEAVLEAQRSIATLQAGLDCGRANGLVDVVIYGGPQLTITAEDIDDEREVWFIEWDF